MQSIIVNIEKIISNSCGLARHGNCVIFVPDSVPGEKCAVELTDKGKGFYSARLLEVISPSPRRVVPECPLFGECGGCTLQHIDYSCQLEIRKALVGEALERNGKTGRIEATAVPGIPYSYRNRARFHAGEERLPAFRKRGSNDFVGIGFCPVCSTGINTFLEKREKITGECLTLFDTGKDVFTDGIFSVDVKDKVIGTDADCFFQSNLYMLEKAVDLVCEHAEGSSFFDLYCGTGVFGSFLAEKGERVVSVESDRKAVSHARKNISSSISSRSTISGNTIFQDSTSHGCTSLNRSPQGGSSQGCTSHGRTSQGVSPELLFYAVPVESFIRSYRGALPDTAVLDPPRSGLSRTVRKYLTEKRIKKLLYLSCDYATLGRDTGELAASGYRITDLYFLDFYPQTAHAESLAVMEYVG